MIEIKSIADVGQTSFSVLGDIIFSKSGSQNFTLSHFFTRIECYINITRNPRTFDGIMMIGFRNSAIACYSESHEV